MNCVSAPEAPRLLLARKFGGEATVNIEEFKTPDELHLVVNARHYYIQGSGNMNLIRRIQL